MYIKNSFNTYKDILLSPIKNASSIVTVNTTNNLYNQTFKVNFNNRPEIRTIVKKNKMNMNMNMNDVYYYKVYVELLYFKRKSITIRKILHSMAPY